MTASLDQPGVPMILFETDKKPLTFLLDQIEQRELSLPDFQRSFVWDANETRGLAASVVQSFPAGTLLLMRGGGKVFAPRAFEAAPDLDAKVPSYLVLDGQQRLTSLYQAFTGTGTHRFFLNLQELIDGEDVDEAMEVYLAKRAMRWAAIDGQARDLMLPLSQVRQFAEWKDEVLDLRPQGEDRKKLRTQLNELDGRYIKAVEGYHFPVTTLGGETPIEAICTIFETLNRTGVKLSVFELLTARAFAHDVRLRDMWADTRDEHPILDDFAIDPYYILQAISVRVRGSAKRSSVLALGIPEMLEEWPRITRGMAAGLQLLRDQCGVLVERWLPYRTMLVTLAATWHKVDDAKGPVVGERRGKLRRWFWCATFSGTYDNSSNSTAEADKLALEAWLDGGDEPAVVQSFSFDVQRWRDVTARQRALYQSTIALLMAGGPRDFHDGTPLTRQLIDGRLIDDHHIFPRAWLKTAGFEMMADTVLNHTLLGKTTNILIGARAPSVYLQEMRDALKDELGPILVSHGLPSDTDGPLFRDRFEEFLTWRLEHLSSRLASVTSGG
jgi:hypothetical protein